MVLQVKPGSHAAVPQHAWPSPPQAIIPMPGWQVPEVQVRPLLQAVPPQHASLSPPHAPGAPPPSTPGPTPASLPGVGAASQVPPEQTARRPSRRHDDYCRRHPGQLHPRTGQICPNILGSQNLQR